MNTGVNNGNDYDEMESGDQTVAGRRGGSRKMASGDEIAVDAKKGNGSGFKMRLFRVFYWVSKDRNTSMGTAITMIMIMFIQIFDLIISPIMQLPFRGAFYNEVSEIFDIIRLYPIIVQFGGRNVYWFFMFFPLAVTLIYVFLLSLIDASLRANRGKSVQLLATLRILQTMSALMYWVFLIPTVDFFISIYQCDSITKFHKYDPNMICWEGQHAFFCALFGLALILQVTVAVIISLLFNENRPSHTDALTRLDTN
jgi:hypothetical protein